MVLSGTKSGSLVWSGTKCNTMFWAQLPLPNILLSTKCDTIFQGTVSFVTLPLVEVLNATISWHSTTVTILQSLITNTSAKYDTIVHDNICGTKCSNNNNNNNYYYYWSYPSNSAKYVSRLFVYQSSLCPYCVCNIHNWRKTQFIWNFF